jgi:nicotinamidase-related amidase
MNIANQNAELLAKLHCRWIPPVSPHHSFLVSLDKSPQTFTPATAKGGIALDPSKTAVLCIEFQNEFTTEGGKLNPAVDPVMKSTGMLEKAVETCAAARAAGAKVFHEAICFEEDASDNPNKGLGILNGCAEGKLFTAGTWNADFCEAMKPKDGDVVVNGKRGLDGFPGTDLEEKLKANGIETVVICGFLTNCCVESTMRTAYEKGFNVITLTDVCAATSEEGQKGATEGTFGMFSKTMTAEEFKAEISA